jgi:hypothetical protein
MSGGWRTLAHNSMVRLIGRTMAQAGLMPRFEVRPWTHLDSRTAQTARLDIAVRLPDTPLIMSFIDVSLTYPMGVRNLPASAKHGADAAAELADAAKHRTYGAYVNRATEELVPVIFDLLGGMNKAGRALLRLLIRRWGRSFQLHTAVASRMINHRLSFELTRQVAKLALNNAAAQLTPAHTSAPPVFA